MLLDWANKKVYSLFENNPNFWIAGGSLFKKYIGNETRSDIDLYFPNLDEYNKAIGCLLNNYDCLIDRETENSKQIRFSPSVRNGSNRYFSFSSSSDQITFDFVKIFSDSPEKTIGDFDFTICAIAADRDSIYYHENFKEDVKNKKIRINSTLNSHSSLFRLKKYNDLGYSISDEDFSKVIEETARKVKKEIHSCKDLVLVTEEAVNLKLALPSSSFAVYHDVFTAPQIVSKIKNYCLSKDMPSGHIEDYLVEKSDYAGWQDLINLCDSSIFDKKRIFTGVLKKYSDRNNLINAFVKEFLFRFPECEDFKKFIALT